MAWAYPASMLAISPTPAVRAQNPETRKVAEPQKKKRTSESHKKRTRIAELPNCSRTSAFATTTRRRRRSCRRLHVNDDTTATFTDSAGEAARRRRAPQPAKCDRSPHRKRTPAGKSTPSVSPSTLFTVRCDSATQNRTVFECTLGTHGLRKTAHASL